MVVQTSYLDDYNNLHAYSCCSAVLFYIAAPQILPQLNLITSLHFKKFFIGVVTKLLVANPLSNITYFNVLLTQHLPTH